MFLKGATLKSCMGPYESVSIYPFDEANLNEGGELTLTLSPHFRQLRLVGQVDARQPPEDLFVEREMDPDEGLLIQPGQFFLLETAERIKLQSHGSEPVGCLLATRPKLAQLGLDVMQGSSFVRPGSDCRLTLETSNCSQNAIRVYPGLKIVKALFYFMR